MMGNVHPIRSGGRTQEQVIAQLEARYAEMEAEAASRAADPEHLYPCDTCRWGDHFETAWCHHPLVKGFGDRFYMGMDHNGLAAKRYPPLCGPEKALWELKAPPQRAIRWVVTRPWLFVLIPPAAVLFIVGCARIGMWLAA
jgi:hypothetical protein